METLVNPQPFIPALPVCPQVGQVASFSRFSFFTKPIENKQPTMEFSLVDAYNYIRGGVSALATAHLRSLPPAQRPAFKRSNFDFCTFSGVFRQRKAEQLIRHSYLVCFDFDHLTDVEAVALTLLDDPYFETMLLFRSPSGDGLKWVVSMEQNYAYRERFFPVETPASYHAPYSIISSLPILSKSMRSARTFPVLASFHSTLTHTSTLLCHDKTLNRLHHLRC